MAIEYIYTMISLVSLVIGVFIGVQVVKFFSDELIYKLENSLENQLEVNQNTLNRATEIMIEEGHKKVDFIKQINEVLKKTKVYLHENSQKIEHLNQMCNKRSELEAEIVKLKKIIQRLEKRT